MVDLAPGTRLYQISNQGRLILLDVHPASLSQDGVFVLVTPNKVFCHCGPKVCFKKKKNEGVGECLF